MADLEYEASVVLSTLVRSVEPYKGFRFDEWWETDRDDEFVVVGEGKAFRIRVTEVPLPAFPPSAWMDGEGPHPYTGEMYRGD